jgi:LPS-assembly protein
MPAFMLRWSPFRTAIVALGSMIPVAWGEEPLCPSQSAAAAAAGSTGVAALLAPATPGSSAAGVKPAPDSKIEVTADAVDADVAQNAGKATLKGNVEVRQGERVIHTNEAQLDRLNGSVATDSHVDYSDPLVQVSGTSGSYSASSGAEFTAAQFSLRQRPARGAAQQMQLTPQGVLRLKGVIFTTCPLRDESWHIKAESIVLDTRAKIGTARDAQIDFMGVPLMYLPWVSFPLSTERKSGFLFPTIGNMSYGGLELSLPYYWNIAPNVDFTFEPTEYSHAGPDLGGDLRFLTADQHGELDWNYLPYDKSFDGSRDRVRFLDVADLPDFWRLTLHAEEVSDPFYFEDFSQGPEGTSTAFLERSATFSYRDEHWRVDGEAQQYQTIDYTLSLDERPYARVPRIAASSDFTLGGIFHYGFDSELVDFQRPGGTLEVSGWRADVAPEVYLDLSGPGYFVRPAFAWRATQYELDYTLPGESRSPSRTVPIASFDSGLKFERASGSHDQRRLTLEPRLLYLKVPYRDQQDLPVFDSALPDLLNPVELFRTNRFVGADRQSDADQLTVGVTSRLLDAQNGRQFIAATFGQTYSFEPPRVLLPGEVPGTEKRSNLVAQLALTAFEDWSAGVGVLWDPQTQGSEETQLNLQYKPAGNSVVNLAYRYERYTFDQVEASGAWPIGRNWNVFARGIYSLSDHEYNLEQVVQPGTPQNGVPVSVPLVGFLERFAGFEYRACCWRARLGVRRYVSNHNGTQDTGVWLQLELGGLASVGSATDASLGQEIRGYVPPEGITNRNSGPLKGVW